MKYSLAKGLYYQTNGILLLADKINLKYLNKYMY